MGTPVSSISEILVQSGAMEGKHTIDVSILLLPVIMELIAYVADESGVDYNMGLTPTIDQDKISESKIALSVSKLKKKMPEIMVEETEPTMEDENMPEENSEPSGLMSRRM